MRIPAIDIAVDGPLALLYPGREPFVFTFPGGALSGVSVFTHDGPHFHYVGYGLESRFGCELSFRLEAPRDVLADEAPSAPAWPARLLLSFAEHAVKQARGFERGHYLCLPEPWPDGSTRCGLLVEDPELGALWLQIVGLHEAELGWASSDGWRDLVAALSAEDPLLVTRPDRGPVRRVPSSWPSSN